MQILKSLLRIFQAYWLNIPFVAGKMTWISIISITPSPFLHFAFKAIAISFIFREYNSNISFYLLAFLICTPLFSLLFYIISDTINITFDLI